MEEMFHDKKSLLNRGLTYEISRKLDIPGNEIMGTKHFNKRRGYGGYQTKQAQEHAKARDMHKPAGKDKGGNRSISNM